MKKFALFIIGLAILTPLLVSAKVSAVTPPLSPGCYGRDTSGFTKTNCATEGQARSIVPPHNKCFVATLSSQGLNDSFSEVSCATGTIAQPGDPPLSPLPVCDLRASDPRLLGMPTWYKYLQGEKEATGRCSPKFNIPDDVGKVLLAIVEIMLRVAGLVAVGYIIYGGFKYMLSHGEPDGAKAARTTIINALVGLVIAVFATVIVNIIGNTLIKG